MICEEKPLVSIVIPNYNHGRYLGRALQSVLDQSYENWEAIIVDNYSTDETDEVIAKFADSRISCVKIDNNGVIAVSRNMGLRLSRGSYIAFLDADDWWANNKILMCLTILEAGYDVVYHELQIVQNDEIHSRKRLIGSWQVKSPVQVDLLLRGNALATSSVVVRSDVVKKLSGFNESSAMVACEDYNLWLQVAGVTEKFFYCRDVLGYYWEDGEGMSNKDMSSVARCATDPFRGGLSTAQERYLDSKLDYLKLRYFYRTGSLNRVKNQYRKCAFRGPVLNRVKSLYMYLLASLRLVL